jgi:hypothetical protein
VVWSNVRSPEQAGIFPFFFPFCIEVGHCGDRRILLFLVCG